MIKRSVPNTFLVKCPTIDYAQGVAMGVHEALNCLMHECDIIMRTDTEISEMPKAHIEHDQEYLVRARFTVREKQNGLNRGQIIKINKAYYEEEISNNFDIARNWVGLTTDEIDNSAYPHFPVNLLPSLRLVVRQLEKKLKEKNDY